MLLPRELRIKHHAQVPYRYFKMNCNSTDVLLAILPSLLMYGTDPKTIDLVLPRFNCKLLLTAHSSIALATALSWIAVSSRSCGLHWIWSCGSRLIMQSMQREAKISQLPRKPYVTNGIEGFTEVKEE